MLVHYMMIGMSIWLVFEFANNSTVSVSSGKTPFELNYGEIPRMPIDHVD